MIAPMHQIGHPRVCHPEGGEGKQFRTPDDWPAGTATPVIGNDLSGSQNMILPSHAGTSAAESVPSSAPHRLPKISMHQPHHSCATKGSLQQQWPSGISAVFNRQSPAPSLLSVSNGHFGSARPAHQGSSVKTCFVPRRSGTICSTVVSSRGIDKNTVRWRWIISKHPCRSNGDNGRYGFFVIKQPECHGRRRECSHSRTAHDHCLYRLRISTTSTVVSPRQFSSTGKLASGSIVLHL